MDTMLSSALREFTTGPLNQLLVNLGGQNGAEWEQELKKFLRKEPCWSDKVYPIGWYLHLLESISTVIVSATPGVFVSKEKFICDTGRKTRVKIRYIDSEFIEWFLSGDGKTEEPITETTLRYAKLCKSSMTILVVNGLGGEEKSETTLSEMFSLMEGQKNGESGPLLNDGCTNAFFVRDKNGVFRGVFVEWHQDGWSIDAGPVWGTFWFKGGSRVFSRV